MAGVEYLVSESESQLLPYSKGHTRITGTMPRNSMCGCAVVPQKTTRYSTLGVSDDTKTK